MCNHFEILGIKGLRIFIKKFHGICCYFLLVQPLSLRQLAYIDIYVHVLFNCQRINYIKTLRSKHASTLSTQTRKHAKQLSTQARDTQAHFTYFLWSLELSRSTFKKEIRYIKIKILVFTCHLEKWSWNQIDKIGTLQRRI